MKVGVMIKEVLPHLFKRPNTILYPFQKTPPPEGFRGKPVLDTEKCRGCPKCACELICPAEACKKISIGDEIDRLAFWYDRCIYCGECEERCPFDAVKMTDDYELAAYDIPSLYEHPQLPESEEALALIEKARDRKKAREERAAEAKAKAEAEAAAKAAAPAEAEDKASDATAPAEAPSTEERKE